MMKSTIYARKDPYVLMLILGIVGSVIIFLFLSVIYIIRKAAPGWTNFSMPSVFWVSTALILLSSGTLFIAKKAFRKENFSTYRLMLGVTLFLGISFCVSQIAGWNQLVNSGIKLTGSTSAAFMYIFSGFHLLHILGGLLVLLYAFIDAIRNASYIDSYIQSLNPIKTARLRMISLYWHFVDILWIYLFGFLWYHYGAS